MRVISGFFKGRVLKSPTGIRPVTGMIKGAIFNILSHVEWEECEVLDLFAGSGNFGIESLSRGAKKVIFVDKASESRRIILENLKGVDEGHQIITGDIRTVIKNLYKKGLKFNIIFADPPFDKDFGSVITGLLEENPLLKEGGMLILRVRDKERIEFSDKMKVETRKYGDSAVYFIKTEGGCS
jgi:16S rRNA (guanine966-N2)-methyltransferase